MPPRILVIEDETAIRDMIRFSMQDEFILINAENTIIAKKELATNVPDLILLDWMLPGESGISFINWIKQQNHLRDIPIIMLTAKAEEENKVRGLMTGADDYITKPFSPTELLARIKAVLRRGPLISPSNKITAHEITLNIATNQVIISGEVVQLTPIEYKMLLFFMRHPNRTYTREQLIKHIWGQTTYIDDRTVDAQVRRLRDKLKQYKQQDLIKTIRGTGYQFSSNE